MIGRGTARWRCGCWAAIVVAGGTVRADEPPPARTPVRVGVAPLASIVEWDGESPTGPMPEIWERLARTLDLESTFVRMPTVIAAIDRVERGGLDVVLGPVAITEERERSLDLTHPIFHSGMRITIRQKSDTGLLGAARSLFTWRLLGLLAPVAALALLSGHLLWWFERGDNPESFPRGYRRGVGEALWWIASTVVTGGCDAKHVDGWLGRVIALAWMIGGIAVAAGITSVLTATMTTEQMTGVIHGPRDLVGRLVGVQEAAVTTGVVRQRGGFPREYATLRAALVALDVGEIEAVVAPNEVLSALVAEMALPRLRIVGPLFDVFDFGIALPTGSPLREGLNKALLRMREDGEITRIQERWMGKHD